MSSISGISIPGLGIGNGLDINSMIQQLVQVQSIPITQLQARQQTQKDQLAAIDLVSSKFSAVQNAAIGLSRASTWSVFTATSSNPSAVTASASSSALTGSITFTVDNLASAGAVRSANTVAATSTTIASGPILLAKGGSAFGFAALKSDSNLATGAHTIVVTQASAAATRTPGGGDSALAGSTVITAGVNDQLQVDVNGTPTVLTLAAGTYDPTQLAAAVQTASNGALTASVDGSGKLVLATTAEGSAASVQVTGGTALGALGLTVDGAAATGTDGIVTVDGTQTVVNDVQAGAQVVLAAPAGTVTATLSGGLRAGTVNATQVAITDGTLSGVVSAINNASAGVSATAVKVGTNAYRLQLASTTTGANSDVDVDGTAFTGLGSMVTLTQGADAQITVGSGAGAYQVTSSTNTVTDLVPGLTLTLVSPTATPTTVTIDHDAGSLADLVQALATAANDALNTAAQQTAYDATNQTAAPLLGDLTVQLQANRLVSAITSAVPGSTLGSAGLAGLQMDKDGNVTFDRAKFLSAYQTDPTAVMNLFVQQGSAVNSAVSFVRAGDRSAAGTYDVTITAPATQATATGATLANITNAETIDLLSNGVQVTYNASPGESINSIAAALSNLFASQKLDLTVDASSGALVVKSGSYGSATTFQVRTSDVSAGQTGLATVANQWQTMYGSDVQGTIDGRAATGSGQFLTVQSSDDLIPGLTVLVTATSPGDLGNVTYTPGVAARMDFVSANATDLLSGAFTAEHNSLQATIDDMTDQITQMQKRVDNYQTSLQQQFATLDSTMGQLRAQLSWLQQQLGVTTSSSSSGSGLGSG
jgi:flagellar hook-associated protein 2